MVLAAGVFVTLSIAVALFQIVLALGAPLGEFTLGGAFPGRLPVKLRVAALAQILVLLVFVFMVVSKAGVAFGNYAHIGRIGVWVVVAFFSLGTVMNLSSPSKKEKMVMGPANVVALLSSLVVALG